MSNVNLNFMVALIHGLFSIVNTEFELQYHTIHILLNLQIQVRGYKGIMDTKES